MDIYHIAHPRSPVLREHIRSFNIIREPVTEWDPLSYFAFPQTGISLAINAQANFQYNDREILFSKSTVPKPTLLILGKYLLPLYLTYQAYIPEISINFTATGINYFFEGALSEFGPKIFQFYQDPAWEAAIESIFQGENHEEQFIRLEKWLLSQFRDKKLGNLESVAQQLAETPGIKIQTLAEEFQINERTLNRNFKKYVGCSPAQYRKICRFRNSINYHFQQGGKVNITDIGLSNDFYDSPHFTREFLRLTGRKPRTFFHEVKSIGEQYPYIFG